MSDGLAKDLKVVRGECSVYASHCRREWYRIRALSVPWYRKLHHLSGLGPDAHRIMPRTLWYLGWLSLPVLAVLVWWLW